MTEQSDVNKVTEQSDVNKVTNGRKYTPEGENANKEKRPKGKMQLCRILAMSGDSQGGIDAIKGGGGDTTGIAGTFTAGIEVRMGERL